MVDYLEALKRPFSDLNKLIIGLILGSIPIVNLTVRGYTLVSTGFTKEKVEKTSLPEWRNYRDLFMKGLVAAIISFLLFLPSSFVAFGAFGTVASSPALNQILGGISPDTWNRLFAGEISDIEVEDWFSQNWTQFIPIFLSATPFIILGIVLSLIASYIMPVVILSWLKADNFSSGFSWNVIKKAFTADYLVSWIAVGIVGLVVGAVLGWIPLLGSGITMYVTGVFSYTVFAEIYERL
jgi:hypothetical protein